MKTSAKASIKRSARKLNMQVAGDFLIVFQNDEITSGIAIDAAPSATYFWIFILPTYDNLAFLHMSLGERVALSDRDNDCLIEAYEAYRSKVEWVKSTNDLLAYLDQEKFPGEYPVWVRLIANAYLGNFSVAESLLKTLAATQTSKALQVKIDKVRDELLAAGWPAVQKLLGEWSKNTKRLVNSKPA